MLFQKESEMQAWLSDKLTNEECFDELIINIDKIRSYKPQSKLEIKLHHSYLQCLKSLSKVWVISEDENISFNPQDILRPDFLLFAPETDSIVLIELKNLVTPMRQVGTELAAYAGEIKTYLPFLSDGDVVNVVISSVWTSLIKHYILQEVFWMNRNFICIEPIQKDGDIFLKVIEISTFIDQDISLRLSEKQLGGYQICLYDYNPQNKKMGLDSYLEQMKTALSVMSITGNSLKNHGFAFLWKNKFKKSDSPYNITILNFAPYQFIERFFHDVDFEPNEIVKRFVSMVIAEDMPIGDGESLSMITNTGISFLELFCSPRTEGYMTWEGLREVMIDTGDLVSFYGWGVIADLFSDRLLEKYKNGHTNICFTDTDLGLKLIDEIVDPNYIFFDLSNCSIIDEEDDFN